MKEVIAYLSDHCLVNFESTIAINSAPHCAQVLY